MTHTLKRLSVKAVVALGLGLGAWTSGVTQQLYWSNVQIGSLYYDYLRYYGVTGVSDTGVVVGTWNGRGFRWHNEQFQYLPLPQNYSSSEANDISADGTIIVGNISSRPVRWVNDQPQFLGGDGSWRAQAVSADGRVIVGGYRLWKDGQVHVIPIDATDVSADGSVVVGTGDGCISFHPARWTAANGVQYLPVRDYDCYYDPWWGYTFQVYGVSGDGQTVIGSRHTFCGSWVCELFVSGVLWQNPDSLYRYLAFQFPLGISRDGRTVVGQGFWIDSDDDIPYVSEHHGFVYRREWGDSRNINQLYSALLTDGSKLYPTAVSPNGRYIAGIGYNAARQRNEAFLLDTWVSGDVNGDGCVDDADLLAVLFNFGQSGSGLSEDVNGDGTVDDADLLLVLFNFGSGC